MNTKSCLRCMFNNDGFCQAHLPEIYLYNIEKIKPDWLSIIITGNLLYMSEIPNSKEECVYIAEDCNLFIERKTNG